MAGPLASANAGADPATSVIIQGQQKNVSESEGRQEDAASQREGSRIPHHTVEKDVGSMFDKVVGDVDPEILEVKSKELSELVEELNTNLAQAKADAGKHPEQALDPEKLGRIS